MNYIHVTTPNLKKDENEIVEKVIANYNRSSLISLIPGLSPLDFGYDTIYKTATDIRKYSKKYLKENTGSLFIDSGGYSIIEGKVGPQDTQLTIDSYHIYLQNHINDFDRIFSLDVPINTKYPSFNTKANIYEFNKRSLSASKMLLQSITELSNNFFFIWHFKMHSQWDIWKQIYKELNLNDIVINRAIGGMVGLKGLTGIKFSPFIAVSYRCLLDFLQNPQDAFRLHFLGIYTLPDRFIMVFMENLFQRYLGNNTKIEFTYDTINNTQGSMYAENLKKLFYFEDDTLYTFNGVDNIEDFVLQKVFDTNKLFDWIKEEIDMFTKTGHKSKAVSFAPILVMSNISLNQFFETIMDRYDFIDKFLMCQSKSDIDKYIGTTINGLTKMFPDVITPTLGIKITESFKMILPFHTWLIHQGDYASLDYLIIQFINNIGFPDQLR